MGADTGVQILPLDSWADSWRGCTSVLTRRAEIGSNYAVGFGQRRQKKGSDYAVGIFLSTVSVGCIDGKGSDSGRNYFSSVSDNFSPISVDVKIAVYNSAPLVLF